MLAVDIISRIVHVLTAITMLGGSLFMLLVLIPSLQANDDSTRREIMGSVRQRWQRIVHSGILLFLLSGFYNYFRAMPKHKGDGLYHALVGTKILLALGIFFLASVLVGRSSKFEPMRANTRKWLTIICLLGIIIVAISGFVKINS
jgi:uncharacterized membrane protein